MPKSTAIADIPQEESKIDAEISEDVRASIRIVQLREEVVIVQQRRKEFLSELARLEKNLANAGQAEARAAVSEQLKKFDHESVKKITDRVYQSKLNDPQTGQLSANIVKMRTAIKICEDREREIKSQIAALEKQRIDTMAEAGVHRLQKAVDDWSGHFLSCSKAWPEVCDAINGLRAVDPDLAGRLKQMRIVNSFLVQFNAQMSGSVMSEKMMPVLNSLVTLNVPGNPFFNQELRPVTGQQTEGRFGLERPFGVATAQG